MNTDIWTAAGRYSELHAHSWFSLLDGVPSPVQLADGAAQAGLRAIALTDHDAIYGAVPFFARCRELGVKPLLGAELTLEDDAHLTVLAEDRTGYRSLCRLISAGRFGQQMGTAALPWAALRGETAGLICLTGCRRGPVAHHWRAGHPTLAGTALDQLVDLFGPGDVYVELQRNHVLGDMRFTRGLAALAASRRLPIVATGSVHYLKREDAGLQDALVRIREKLPWPKKGDALRANHQYMLRSPAEMAKLFADLPEAAASTAEIAARCNVALPNGMQVLPVQPTPNGISALEHLRQLCEAALPVRYPHNQAEARALLEKELGVIGQMGNANYFLIVLDIVGFCLRRDILFNLRGSGGNSLVLCLLGVSSIDPLAHKLVFERFLNLAVHGNTPDIDIDLEAAKREIVIQWVYDHWGREHAAMACNYITYRTPSAIRDAGYALGCKPETIEQVAQAYEAERHQDVAEGGTPAEPARPRAAKLSATQWKQLMELAQQLKRRPRHLGLHSGGMVITGAPISDLIPIEPATMENRTVVQYNKEHLEQSGIVKIDLLGLRMLSVLADAVRLIKQTRGKVVDLMQLDYCDPRVYDRICTALTIGIFQLESGAQIAILPHMQPRNILDLAEEIGGVRTGTMQKGNVHALVRRRQGLEPVTYLHPSLEPVLKETLGVVLFQEHVAGVAEAFAGMPPDRGELLRKTMANPDAVEELSALRDEFFRGALGRGASLKVAEQVWQSVNIEGYWFSKAHALEFAEIAYRSAWLHLNYTVEYFCALLGNVPLGTYPAHVLESEAKRLGVRFVPFDINRSLAKPTVERTRDGLAIRYGLEYVKGLGDTQAQGLVQLRNDRPFQSANDLIARTQLDLRTAENLILAGACDAWGERRQLLWDLGDVFDLIRRPSNQLALGVDVADENASLAPMAADKKLIRAFATTGVTGGMHLTKIRRDAFTRAGCLPYADLLKRWSGSQVKVGGIVADGLRHPREDGPSYMRLEYPEGLVDIVVPRKLYAECRAELRGSFMAFMVVEGTLKRNGPVLSVTAKKVSALPA